MTRRLSTSLIGPTFSVESPVHSRGIDSIKAPTPEYTYLSQGQQLASAGYQAAQ